MTKKQNLWDAAGLGIFVAVSICLGILGGWWLDGKIGTFPLFFFIGFAAGVTAAGMEVWRVVKKSMKD